MVLTKNSQQNAVSAITEQVMESKRSLHGKLLTCSWNTVLEG